MVLNLNRTMSRCLKKTQLDVFLKNFPFKKLLQLHIIIQIATQKLQKFIHLGYYVLFSVEYKSFLSESMKWNQ